MDPRGGSFQAPTCFRRSTGSISCGRPRLRSYQSYPSYGSPTMNRASSKSCLGKRFHCLECGLHEATRAPSGRLLAWLLANILSMIPKVNHWKRYRCAASLGHRDIAVRVTSFFRADYMGTSKNIKTIKTIQRSSRTIRNVGRTITGDMLAIRQFMG